MGTVMKREGWTEVKNVQTGLILIPDWTGNIESNHKVSRVIQLLPSGT